MQTISASADLAPQRLDLPTLRARQRAFFQSGATRPLAHRRQALDRLLAVVERMDSQIVAALRADLGKSEFEAYSTEIGFLTAEIKEARAHLMRWNRTTRTWSPITLQLAYGEVKRVPHGLTLIIAPWNYPLQLALSPLVAAIAAGNCAVIKPSELAPATATIIEAIVREAFAPEHVAVVQGGVPETQALLAAPWDYIFFTGSTQVGKIVAQAAAEHLTPVTLELGGKSPAILTADIPLLPAARRIVFGKFINAGQTCVAPDYLLVDRRILPQFTDALQTAIEEQFGRDPLRSPDLGQIVNERHFRRLSDSLQDEDVVVGGQSDEGNRRIAPTLVLNPASDSPLLQDEIFGPILPILPYDTLDEAIQFVTARPHPLALYVFTTDKAAERAVLDRCTYGGACVNDTIVHLADAGLPFGGVGPSGMGAYHGQHGFQAFSRPVGVLHKVGFLDIALRFAPYTATKVAWIRRLIG